MKWIHTGHLKDGRVFKTRQWNESKIKLHYWRFAREMYDSFEAPEGRLAYFWFCPNGIPGKYNPPDWHLMGTQETMTLGASCLIHRCGPKTSVEVGEDMNTWVN